MVNRRTKVEKICQILNKSIDEFGKVAGIVDGCNYIPDEMMEFVIGFGRNFKPAVAIMNTKITDCDINDDDSLNELMEEVSLINLQVVVFVNNLRALKNKINKSA